MPVALWRLWLMAAAAVLLFGVMAGDVRPVALLLAVVAVAWLPLWYCWDRPAELRRNRKAKGLCVHCG
jgi:hypothetical protein